MNVLHRFFRGLHGFSVDVGAGGSAKNADLDAAYAAYAGAVANAYAMLQMHGPASRQFAEADIAGMRLFHRVKKMQGLGKPRPERA
jgi:hypothetical protein